ncbi:hypothetical protein HHK36_026577 [Tetracentron sinense]|uniref:Pentatricopeptide repeat-containing protein n=1 Tax=Tetracentron sinense TaxID=13715 RepID=A0A834YJW9_TETSI|nr:hypothetical protein HHK36_026577 [Tetracentron sinense]
MKAQGLVPDDVTNTSMIGVLCKANRLDEAVELLKQMELKRKFAEAYKLLERQKEKGCIPSVIAYNCILTCLGKKGRVDEAFRIFEEMKKDAVPNLSTYNIFVDMLCKAGKLEAAFDSGMAWNELSCFLIC